MTKLVAIALVALCPAVAAAQKNQPPPPASTITLQIPGLNCQTPAGTGIFKVEAWSWGASNSSSFIGGTPGAGKPSIQDLSVTKAFDGCSPALLGLVTSGNVIKEVILTQTGADVTRTTTVQLEGVLVSSWSLSSSTSQSAPFESVSFNFRKVCVTDTATSASVCYDSATTQ